MAFGPLPPPPSRDWRSDERKSPPPDDVTRPLEPAGARPQDAPQQEGWRSSGSQWQPPGAPAPGSTATSERPVWAEPEPPPGEPSTTDGMAIAALVLGILGLLTSIFVFGGVLGLIAVGLGIVGIRRARQRGLAIAGVVTGVLAILVSIAVVAAGVALFRTGADSFVEGFGGDLAAGDLMSDSPCADADDAASFPASLSEGGLVVSAVEVCPDSFDDFEFGVQVANESDAAIDAELTVAALDGDTTVSQPAPQPVTLEPGTSGWVRIISFDDYAAFDSVDVQATAS